MIDYRVVCERVPARTSGYGLWLNWLGLSWSFARSVGVCVGGANMSNTINYMNLMC